jgi:hypothetical protein
VPTVRTTPPVLLLALVIAACSASPSSAPGSASAASFVAGALTIEYPANGAIATASPIAVGGHAPSGARVVQDIAFAPDQDVIAASDGIWTLQVALQNGANDLVFRLGDDKATEVHLGVNFQPATSTLPSTAEPTLAIATATPGPSPKPTPTPPPPVAYKTFDDGDFIVGVDISPGTYRLREPASFCYWERLSGFGGTLGEIIANDNADDAYAVVTIGKSDKGFSSSGCGTWTNDLSRVTDSKTKLTIDGTYIVSTDLTPGTWRSSGGEFCYWARLSGFGGTLGSIIANDNVFGGSAVVTIHSTDKGFHTQGCGTWTRT